MQKLEILVVDLHSPRRKVLNGREKAIHPNAQNPDEEARKIGDAFQLIGGGSVSVSYAPVYGRFGESSIDIGSRKVVIISGTNYDGLFKPNGDGALKIDSLIEQVARDIVTQAENNGAYVFGICAASQVLAHLHGGEVFRLNSPEVGLYNVYKTRLGEKDPLLNGLPNPMVLFGYHVKQVILNGKYDESCLAENGNCVQIKKYRDRCYGIQAHIEEARRSIMEYLTNYAKSDKKWETEPSRVDLVEKLNEGKLHGHRIIRNILDMVQN